MKLGKIRPIVTKLKTIKLKNLVTALLIILLITYILIKFWSHKHSKHISTVNLENVIVHFDLKGSPPKLSYLKTLLPMLKSLGATGFLMEYEDMFPYDGRLVNISASNRYTKSEVIDDRIIIGNNFGFKLKDFIRTAVESGFEIIPLVQTFGHLEHVLKLLEFQHLREIPFYPDSICPSQTESKQIIQEMLEQIIEFHTEVTPLKYFHIGCDEVYHINECIQCRGRQLQDIDIFLNHIEAVKDIVKKLSPKTTVLIWDDMLRGQNLSVWDRIKSFNGIEPVYWDYRKKIDMSHVRLLKYHQKFKEIWIASAFKGADGRIATLPNLEQRFLNHFGWMNLIRDYKFGGESNIFKFKGIILTGWSRYSHFDAPCELLPSSIPSLVLNLLVIKLYIEGIPSDYKYYYVDDFFGNLLRDEFNKHLHCGSSISVEYFDNYQCSFEGNDLYKLQRLNDIIHRNITTGFNNINHGLSTIEFYASTNNVNRALAGTNIAWCNNTLIDLLDIEKKMVRELSKYYDRSFVNEYVSLKTNNGKRVLYKLIKGLIKTLNVQTWPRRPYHP